MQCEFAEYCRAPDPDTGEMRGNFFEPICMSDNQSDHNRLPCYGELVSKRDNDPEFAQLINESIRRQIPEPAINKRIMSTK